MQIREIEDHPYVLAGRYTAKNPEPTKEGEGK